MNYLLKNRVLWLAATTIFFAFVFCLISFVNHYNLLTNALDLGLYNNALYSYAHLKFNFSPLLEPLFPHRNQLSDHFDLFLMLISPLYWIFGSNTLLIIQIIAILFGGFGVYKYVSISQPVSYWLPLIATIHFFCMWGLYAALSFDYHSIVISAMLIPWLYYFSFIQHKVLLTITAIIGLSCKENVALLYAMVFVSLFILHYKQKGYRYFLLFLSVLCGFYFVVVMKYLMPLFLKSGTSYLHFEYSVLGENFKEAITTIFSKPMYVFTLLFSDPDFSPERFGIKTETHFYVLLSGGFTFFLNPIMLLPAMVIYVQKLFHNDYTKWGILLHYSIEFVPLIVISFYIWLKEKTEYLKVILGICMICFSTVLTIQLFYNPYSKWHNRRQLNLFDSNHYKREFNTHKVINILQSVPSQYKVSASTKLVPHLAFRDSIYQFHFLGNADLIFLLKEHDDRFPLNEELFQKKIQELKNDTNWISCFDKYNLIVFKRKELDYCINDL